MTDSLLSPPQPLLCLLNTEQRAPGRRCSIKPYILEKHDYKQRQPQTDNNSNHLVMKVLSYWSEKLGRAPCLGTLQQRQMVLVSRNSTGGCWFPSPKLRRTGVDENHSDLINPDLPTCPKKIYSLFWFWWSYGQQQILYSVALIFCESSDCGKVWNSSIWVMGKEVGQQSHVSALDLMDHLLLLRQAAELLGNVFFAKRSSQTQRVMGGTRHKDLHQFCLNSRETVQHQCLPALSMTARSTAEHGSHRRQAGSLRKHHQE